MGFANEGNLESAKKALGKFTGEFYSIVENSYKAGQFDGYRAGFNDARYAADDAIERMYAEEGVFVDKDAYYAVMKELTASFKENYKSSSDVKESAGKSAYKKIVEGADVRKSLSESDPDSNDVEEWAEANDPDYGYCETCKYYGKAIYCSDCVEGSEYEFDWENYVKNNRDDLIKAGIVVS